MKLLDFGLRRVFGKGTLKANEMETNEVKLGLHQTKKLLHSKRNCQQNKKDNQPNGRRYSHMTLPIRG
mgnify:CR=1 FL=1